VSERNAPEKITTIKNPKRILNLTLYSGHASEEIKDRCRSAGYL
jgi:hypothetical protein